MRPGWACPWHACGLTRRSAAVGRAAPGGARLRCGQESLLRAAVQAGGAEEAETLTAQPDGGSGREPRGCGWKETGPWWRQNVMFARQ